MKNKKRIIAVASLLVLAVGGYAFAQNLNTGEPQALNAAVTSVSRRTLETTITAQGDVSLLESEVVFINNTLEVAEVLVRENDVVGVGDPLIVFQTSMQDRERQRETLLHNLADTELTLRSQQVSLENLRLGATNTEIENANLNVTRAEQGIQDAYFGLAQIESNIVLQESTMMLQERLLEQRQQDLVDAQTNLSNTEVLFTAGAATQNQLDSAQRAVENAQLGIENAQTDIFRSNESMLTLEGQRNQAIASITSAEDNLRFMQVQAADVENRINSPQNVNAMAQQQIAIERTRLAIQEIQRNINNLDDVEEILYSTTSGTIIQVNVTSGGIAQQGAPLIQIADAGAFVIRAFVNERHAGQLSLGQVVDVEGSILGNEVLQGRLSSISTIATTTNIGGVAERVVPIEITLDNHDTSVLIPGVSLDITITTDVRENVVAIPLLATLIDPNGETFVYVVNSQNQLEQRFVEVVTYADMYIEVTGVSEGEVILVQPQPAMYEGMLVHPIG